MNANITFALSNRIQKLSAFDNQLTYAPVSLFQLPTMKKLNLARNNISSLFGELEEGEEADGNTWGCTALKVLTLSFNQLKSLPNGIQGAVGLTKLYLDNNNLRDFPMAWKCPLVRWMLLSFHCVFICLLELICTVSVWELICKLIEYDYCLLGSKEILDLSHNKLTSFSCNMEMVWDTSLKRLYLSSNHLGSISWNLCQLSGLQDLDMSHNNIRMLPKPEFWTYSTLHKLNLSFNKVKRLK